MDLDRATNCYEEGTSRYPGIDWPVEDFAATWSAALVHDPALQGTTDDFVRLACLTGRKGAAEVFEREYLRGLRELIQRTCGSVDATESTMQLLREKLLMPGSPKLAAYVSSGSFRAWLKVVAARTALDTIRQANARFRLHCDLSERLRDMATDPEGKMMREDQRAAFHDALRSAIARLPDKERQALRMHIVLDWNVTQIGRAFSVHRATAARWLITAKEQLNQALRGELEARARLAPDDAIGFFRDVRSRLDLSLSRVFATAGITDVAPS